jgi:hypothetical protein
MDATTINAVSGIGSRKVSARVGLSTGKAITGQPPAGSPVEDTVELSPAGIALSRAEVRSCVRRARILDIRAEIKAGTFLTPERMDGTIERLLEILGLASRTEAQAATRRMTERLCKSKGDPMKNSEPIAYDADEAQEIARQADVELAVLLGIEQTLRIALQWMTRGRGNSHKLSTLHFQAWSFERHLARIQVLADHGGYMHLITDAHPHLAGEVK